MASLIKQDVDMMDVDDGPPAAKKPKGVPQIISAFGELHERVPAGTSLNVTFTTALKEDKPWFISHLTVGGVQYQGQGLSKKDAKNNVAQMILPTLPPPANENKGSLKRKRAKNAEKTAIQQLTERINGINDKMIYEQTTKDDKPWFTCSLTMEGRTYNGEGKSKKDARAAMAEMVMPTLPDITAPSGPKFPPTLCDQAFDRLKLKLSEDTTLAQPAEGEETLKIFTIKSLTDKKDFTLRPEERLYQCDLTLKGKTFSAQSISKKGAKGLCAIQALKTVYKEDTGCYTGKPSVELKGHHPYFIVGELCARRGIRISSKPSSEPIEGNAMQRTYTLVVTLSNGQEYTSGPSPSKKKATDNVARKILKKVFRMLDSEINEIEAATVS